MRITPDTPGYSEHKSPYRPNIPTVKPPRIDAENGYPEGFPFPEVTRH